MELATLTVAFNTTNNYLAVRDRFCAISIALNEQGLWAPAFRPQPRVPPKSAGKAANPALHLDHLVIDAHWLWARECASSFSGKYQQLLLPGVPFDFDMAGAYAQENWTSDFRAEDVFSLPSAIQWQLCTVKCKSHAERRAALMDGRRNGTGDKRTPSLVAPIRKAIATWARRNHRVRGEEQAYANLWVAREMLGKKCRIQDAAELAGYMS
ncbi:MAG: hypothetical protein Q8L92_14330, partial [Rubrivivax sp.]|nr:hypothetical protein [Rubrivivax sp.]